jgi:predicted sugar kinase
MEMLPALSEGNLRVFGEALFQFGHSVGRHFSKVQGGDYADASMRELVAWLRREPNRGVAQTSWGPTIAICCGDADEAQSIRARILGDSRWSDCNTEIAAPLNVGAAVDCANFD